MRKKLKIPYPRTSSDGKEPLFDCYMRVHQNTLENVSQFLALLLLGGLSHPKGAAGLVLHFSNKIHQSFIQTKSTKKLCTLLIDLGTHFELMLAPCWGPGGGPRTAPAPRDQRVAKMA